MVASTRASLSSRLWVLSSTRPILANWFCSQLFLTSISQSSSPLLNLWKVRIRSTSFSMCPWMSNKSNSPGGSLSTFLIVSLMSCKFSTWPTSLAEMDSWGASP